MTREMALHIKKLVTEPPIHSLRRLSEVICEQYPKEMADAPSGNQLHGDDLVDQAVQVLGEDRGSWDAKAYEVLRRSRQHVK